MIRKIREHHQAGSGLLESVLEAAWGDATPDDRRKFFRVAFRILVAFHILWAFGLLKPFGLIGFAWPSDVDKAIEHTEKAHAEIVAPVNKRLDDIAAEQKQTGNLVRKLAIWQLEIELRELHRVRCTILDESTRYRMDSNIRERQRDYKDLAGEYYLMPACKDL